MSIFTKKTQPATPPAPSLADQLFAASDKRQADRENQLYMAEDYRARANIAEARAAEAGKEADALTQALAILENAGVKL